MINGQVFNHNRCLIDHAPKTTNPIDRMRGLLFRPKLAENEALLIIPCSAVHTIGMGYPLDLVFMDKFGTVLKLVRALAPWRMAACWAAAMTLELRPGEIDRLGLARGMPLQWRERSEQLA